MKKALKLCFFFCMVSACSCLHRSPQYIVLTSEIAIKCNLSETSVQLVEKILFEIEDLEDKNDRDYYISKLLELLNTSDLNTPDKDVPYVAQEKKLSVETISKQYQEILEENGEQALSDYLNREELYEKKSAKKTWKKYRPNSKDAFYYIVNDDSSDILIHINIAIRSTDKNKRDIYFLEDAIEKHLVSAGFSVNVEFVERSGDDVFEVRSDPTEWPTSGNWVGSYTIIAHEIMHLMGLPDEYDRIEVHATNPYLNMENRLYQFLLQINTNIPADAEYGIMCYHNLKPLQRHICEAVGLGKKCTEERKRANLDRFIE